MSVPASTDQAGPAEAILDAAYRCLARHGVAAVSMRQIAREAGVALSQLHYYFRSKEQLLIEVMRRTTEQHVRAMAQWLAQQPVERRIPGLVSMMRQRLREDPGWFRLLFDGLALALHDPAASRQLRPFFQELAREAAQRLGQLWQPADAGGDVSDAVGPDARHGWPGRWAWRRLSSQALGRIFVAALYGLALQLLLEQDPEGEGEPAWFTEIAAALGGGSAL
ncbi:MAG TPA: helix-turn-helix domain-containing protein [Limnochordales bacterium]